MDIKKYTEDKEQEMVFEKMKEIILSQKGSGFIRNVQFFLKDIDAEVEEKLSDAADAISNKDFNKLKQAIALGADIFKDNTQILNMAIDSQDKEILVYLLEMYKEYSAMHKTYFNDDRFKRDLLLRATKTANLETISILREYGSDINKALGGMIAIAAEHNHLNILKYISEEKIDVSRVVDYPGTSPLLLSGSNGHLEAMKYIISMGIYNQASLNSTLINSAGVSLPVVDYLIKNFKFDDENIIRALEVATEQGNVKIINCILEQTNLKINKLNLAHLAIDHEQKDVLQYFINIGANVNEEQKNTFNDYKTLLIHAIEQRNIGIVEFLIKENADIHYRNELPLLVAAIEAKNDYTILQCLLENGSKLDRFNIENNPQVKENTKKWLKSWEEKVNFHANLQNTLKFKDMNEKKRKL